LIRFFVCSLLIGSNVLLKLPAVLTHNQAGVWARNLTVALRAAPVDTQPVIADASELTQFDSSALAVLLACRREAMALGRTFFVQGLPPRLRQLAGLYGIAALIPSPS
jgi:phospholipid transport system transporter-binding protein